MSLVASPDQVNFSDLSLQGLFSDPFGEIGKFFGALGTNFGGPSQILGVPPVDIGQTLTNFTFGGTDQAEAFRQSLANQVSGFKGDFAGFDPTQFYNFISQTPVNNLPQAASQFNRLQAAQQAAGELQGFIGPDSFIGGLQNFIDTQKDIPSITEEEKAALQRSTRSRAGSELQGALQSIRESFDPSQASAILAGKSLDTRLESSGRLGETLSKQDLAIEQANTAKQEAFGQLGLGVGQLTGQIEGAIANLEAQNFFDPAAVQQVAGGLADAEILNQRLEESLAKQDLHDMIGQIQGQIDRGTQLITGTILPGLFPGRFGGGGGGGSSGKSKNTGSTVGSLGGGAAGAAIGGGLAAAAEGGLTGPVGALIGFGVGSVAGGGIGSLFD